MSFRVDVSFAGQTVGSQPGAYSRVQSLEASGSPTMWPFAGSVERLRPVRWAMLPTAYSA